MKGTSVTVVLVGSDTCDSRWVKYEIEASEYKRVSIRENGLAGFDISKIKSFNGRTSERCDMIPRGYPFYLWNRHDGYNNMGEWIEEAAKAAGH